MRIISTKRPEEKSSCVAQFALIVLAPVLMAAGLYVLSVSNNRLGSHERNCCITAVRFNFTSRKYAVDFEKRINTPTHIKYVTIDGQEKKLKSNGHETSRLTNFFRFVPYIQLSISPLVGMDILRTMSGGKFSKIPWLSSIPGRRFRSLYVLDAAMVFPCVAIFTFFHSAKYLPYLSFRIPKHT